MATEMNSKYLVSIKYLLETGTVRQIVFMVGVALSVALGIMLFTYVQEPTYRPLDYQVTSQNMAVITDTLDKAGIQYKINERDNMLYVAAKNISAAKIKLAATGIAKDDSFNYSFLNEQGVYSNSQFVENARYLRALESDLSKTISAIEGVSAASVHIAIPQNAIFSDESSKVTASVMLSTAPGFSTEKEKINSIMQIIAGSVPGLSAKDVSITDQYGHLLSDGLDQDNMFSSQQLTYQNNLQSYYEKRIASLISPMIGENKISVRVYADIDFTQHEEANEEYNPDKKVIRSEQTLTERSESGGAGGAPGSLSNTPPTDGDADKPATSSGGSGQDRSQSIKNYELGRSVQYQKNKAPKIKSLSVAVVVDNEVIINPKTKQDETKPLDADKINKITSLIKTTIGFNEARGDKVTVINSKFIPAPAAAPLPAQHFWDEPWFWETIKKTIGILLGFIILFKLYKKLASYQSVFSRVESVEDDLTDGNPENLQKQQRLNKLKQLASSDPNKVAQVIKNWVGK